MIKLLFTIALISFSFLSCNNNGPREDLPVIKNKLGQVSDMDVKVIVPDTVREGVEFCALFHVDNPKYTLKQAYFDTKVSDTTRIDTLKDEIEGWRNKLFIQNDTLKICMQPAKQPGGIFHFNRITLLVVDNERNYFYDTSNFKCFVK